ncbi:nucleotide-binding protein [Streptomyces liangshanensis]|uniref:nucleotide-binding protein n=1 Tax=Streptomyces liangshanensis TaxID=2717324 RepID=UPI0036D86B48
MLRIAVVSVKPGVGKTTTGVFLCKSLHELGFDPLLADADKGASGMGWMEDAGGLDFPVVGQSITTLHRALPDLEAGRGAIVVDAPQLEDHEAIGRSALVYADVWLFPMAPAGIEVRRTMLKLRAKLDEARDLREQLGRPRNPLVELVLLTRTNRAYATKTGPDAEYRDALTKRDYRVMKSVVAFNDDLYRQAYGNQVDTTGTTYPEVTKELIEEWERVHP